MSSGYASNTGTTADFKLTRTRLIEIAHEVIRVKQEGEQLDGEQMRLGRDMLGMIVRETDESGKWRWTIGASVSLALQANVGVYVAANGLPKNIVELVSASYRNAEGSDCELTILQAEGYERIPDKTDIGDPKAVYLDDHEDPALKTLRVYPMRTTVTAQSMVVGSDTAVYKCVTQHRSSIANQPSLGGNWSMYWEKGGASVTNWQAGQSYTAPEQIRLLYRRPIADFDEHGQVPDFPLSWPRVILYKLAFDLGDAYGIPLAERNQMIEKAKGAYSDIFPNMRARSTDIHNKVVFF